MQGAALRTRGGAGARLQAGARVCNVGSAWRAAVAGSSRWWRGCRTGWPAAPVRGARSHADSHLAAESATAGQSVRRIQAPTGRYARSPGTKKQRCYLHPHVVQGLSALSVMLGADRTTSHPRYMDGRHHTQGDQVLRPPFLRERRECARVCARLAPVDCMQLGDMQLADVHAVNVLCSTRGSQRFSRSWERASCWGLAARGSVPCSCKRGSCMLHRPRPSVVGLAGQHPDALAEQRRKDSETVAAGLNAAAAGVAAAARAAC